MPQTLQKWGPVCQIEFLRQEPKKHKLSDAFLALDMPILFLFQTQQVLLWLVEFQEDKAKFLIYKLLRYTTDFMEAYPNVLVIPTVLFTDRTTWRKDVLRQLDTKLGNRTFLHFEFVFVKLFDFNARDYYQVANPVVKILLPKMHYAPEERWEVIRQAYKGLFDLVSLVLFEKYRDFIDIYVEVREEERDRIYQEMWEHKETVMIAQLLKEEGIREGKQLGIREGIQEGNLTLVSRLLVKKYRRSPEEMAVLLEGFSVEDFLELGEYLLDCETFDAIEQWVARRKQSRWFATQLRTGSDVTLACQNNDCTVYGLNRDWGDGHTLRAFRMISRKMPRPQGNQDNHHNQSSDNPCVYPIPAAHNYKDTSSRITHHVSRLLNPCLCEILVVLPNFHRS